MGRLDLFPLDYSVQKESSRLLGLKIDFMHAVFDLLDHFMFK